MKHTHPQAKFETPKAYQDLTQKTLDAYEKSPTGHKEHGEFIGAIIKFVSIWLIGFSYVMWEVIFVEKAGTRFLKTIFAPFGHSMTGRAQIFHPFVKIILFLVTFALFYLIATPILAFLVWLSSIVINPIMAMFGFHISEPFLTNFLGRELSPVEFLEPITAYESLHLTWGLSLLGIWVLIASFFSFYRMGDAKGSDVDHPGYVVHSSVFYIVWAVAIASFVLNLYVFCMAALVCAITFSFHRFNHHISREADAIDRSNSTAAAESAAKDQQRHEEKTRKEDARIYPTRVATSTPSRFAVIPTTPFVPPSSSPASNPAPTKTVSPVAALLELDDHFKSRVEELITRASDHTISADLRKEALEELQDAARETIAAHKETVDSDKDEEGGMGPKASYSSRLLKQLNSRGVKTDSLEVEV